MRKNLEGAHYRRVVCVLLFTLGVLMYTLPKTRDAYCEYCQLTIWILIIQFSWLSVFVVRHWHKISIDLT